MPDTIVTTRLIEVQVKAVPTVDIDALLELWIADQALPELLTAVPRSELVGARLLEADVRAVAIHVSAGYVDQDQAASLGGYDG